MAIHSAPAPHAAEPAQSPSRRGRFTVTAWVLGILGVIGTVEGAFILLGGDDQWVGIGGEASWRVGEVDPAWGYGLLGLGIVALLVALFLALRARNIPAAPRGHNRGGWADVGAHAVIFAIVNAFLWAQDFALGGGLDYAYWITIPWGIVLLGQAVGQYVAGHRGGRPAG